MSHKQNGVPSFKKKFVGLIRNLSQPGCTSDQSNDNCRINHSRPNTFIHKYLQGECRRSQPPILHGRSVEQLPARAVRLSKAPIFAAFTGPAGGLAGVRSGGRAVDTAEPDVGYIEDGLCEDDAPNAYVTERPPILTPADPDLKRSETEEIAGVVNWNRPHERAFGLSTTLYERHPVTHERAGNPIADAFGVMAREDNAVLALADGVNWGKEASLAAKCAVHGSMSHLNTALFSPGVTPPKSTTDLFVSLLRSFHSAHSLILAEGGLLTTLTVAVVVPLLHSRTFVVCVCNVGDSLAYVYSQKHGVREITQGSHDIYSMRDMRDALGALGPVDGLNPELNNLTCSMTFAEEGDIVFLTSDGISDNFDPVVGKFVMSKNEAKDKKKNVDTKGSFKNGNDVPTRRPVPAKRGTTQNRRPRANPPQTHNNQTNVMNNSAFRQPVMRSKSQPAVSEAPPRHDPFLPIVEAHQRHELSLLRMEDLLRCGLTSNGPVSSARDLCLEMVHFATKLTVAKRRILEDPELYPPAGEPQELSRQDQLNRRKKVSEKLALVPGKLDHATVVAYKVGRYWAEGSAGSKSKSAITISRGGHAPLASPDSTRSIISQFDDACMAYLLGEDVSSLGPPPPPPSVPFKGRSEKVENLNLIKESKRETEKENENPNTEVVM